MALAFSFKRALTLASKSKPFAGYPSTHQMITTSFVQHQHTLEGSHQTLMQVCKRPPLLNASCWSRVEVHLSKRHFFSKWTSSSSKPQRNPEAKDSDDWQTKDSDRLEEYEEEEEESIIPKTDDKGQPLSNWTRMKIMMKTYGYVIIPVHWVIAPFWFGAFYYTIKLGVDIAPLLRALTVSEHHIEYLQHSKASTALLAYALYKIFTPLRYTVTLGATEMTIRRLRKMGYIKPHPPKEKSYRDSFKETVTEMKDKVKDIRDSRESRND